jgi:murein DD-endopeptidase MepM/ murein hydrolase activator NlpD
MSKQSSGDRFGGKGYYIALGLCAFAIAISGLLYYRNANQTEPTLQDPDNTVIGTLDPGGEIPVGVTQPNETPTTTTIPSNQSPTENSKLGKTAKPVAGDTVAEYAMDCLLYNQTTRDWRTHNGIDLAAQEGSEVVSAADGEVHSIYEDETLGTTVVIRHLGGYNTKYSSLDKELKVEVGQKVAMGQAIGTVGTTALVESTLGPHVHFSVTYQDLPMDPAEFLSLGK